MATTRKVSAIAALAAGTLIAAGSWATAQELVQAGVSAAVRGDVQVARSDAVGRQVNSSEPIYLQDAISSGTDSGMQILLLDETVFTIGPESEMAIDEFVYDPNTGEGSLAANMTRGVMRFVTGNISDGTPENMTIQLPVGTIGIRGTIGLVAVLTEEEALERFPEQASQLVTGNGGGGDQVAQLGVPQAGAPIVFAALVGPGPLTQTNANVGSFNFSTPNGDVDLNRPNSAVLASPDQPPLIFLAPPGSIQGVTNDLSGGDASNEDDDAGQDSDEGGSNQQNTDASEDDGGQSDTGDSDQAGTSEDSGDSGQSGSDSQAAGGSSTSGVSDQSGAGNDVSFGQVLQTNELTGTTSSTSQTVASIVQSTSDDITFADISAAHTGSLSSSCTSCLTGGITGNFQSFFDLSNRTFDFQFNNLNGGGLSSAAFGLTGDQISVTDGFTGFVDLAGTDSRSDVTNCSNCFVNIDFPSVNSIKASVTHTGTTGSVTDDY